MKKLLFILGIASLAFAQTNPTTRPVTVSTQYDGGIGPHQNLLTYSEDYTQAAWVKSDCGGSTITSSVATAPNGNSQAQSITRGSSSCSGLGALYQQASGNASGQILTFSIWAKTLSSTANFTMIVSDGTHTVTSGTKTATTTWQQFFVTGSGTFTNTGNMDGGIVLPNSGEVLVLWGAQLETGTATPRAYVYNGATATALSYGSWSNVPPPSQQVTVNGTSISIGGSAAVPQAGASDAIANVDVMGTDSGKAPKISTAVNLAKLHYVAGGGTAQAQAATYSPAVGSLAAGTLLCWLPSNANTGAAPTFAPNGLTAHTIVKSGGAALVAGDLSTTAVACAIYDTAGTQWELQNPQSAPSTNATQIQGRNVTASAPSDTNVMCWNAGTTTIVWCAATAASSLAWQNLTNPLSNLALSMSGYTSTYTWNAATGSNNLWTFTDTTGNTGTGYMININTASGSSLKPFFIGVNGNGAGMNASAVFAAIGTGQINATHLGGQPAASYALTSSTALAGDICGTLSATISCLSVKNPAFAGGAVGNGSHDDTAAFSAAITACGGSTCRITIPTGTYKITSGLTIAQDHVTFDCIGNRNATIDFEPTANGTAITFDKGSNAIYNSIRGCQFISSDTTYNKVAIKVVDQTDFRLEQISVYPWFGGTTGSTALILQGRDNSTYDDFTTYSDIPVQIQADPYLSSISLDHVDFHDFYLIGGAQSPCWEAATNTYLTHVSWTGFQSWVICNNGFYWHDTTSTAISIGLNFENARLENQAPLTGTVNTSGTAVTQATWTSGSTFLTLPRPHTITIAGTMYYVASVTDATHLVLASSAGTQTGATFTTAGYMFHIDHHTGMQSVNIKNAYSGSTATGNGVFARNTQWLTLENYLYQGTSQALNLDSTDSDIQMTQVWGQNGSTFSFGSAARIGGCYTVGGGALACYSKQSTGTVGPTATTIASGATALGTSAIASGACATVVTATATGAATTDILEFSPNASIKALTGYAPVTTGGLIIYGYTGSNSANWDVCNPTSASITPSAVTLNWRITR